MPDRVIHLDRLLTNVSVKYRNADYIWRDVFPSVPVVQESNQYLIYGVEGFRVGQTRVGKMAQVNTVGWNASTGSYNLAYHALRGIITERDTNNADSPQSVEIDVTESISDRLNLRLEIAAATVAFTTTSWGGNATLVSTTSWRYNTVTSNNPAINAHSAASFMVNNAAKVPNKLAIGYGTYTNLQDNTFILSRIQYVERAIVTKDILASLFDIQEVRVGMAIQTQNAEGLGDSTTAVWAGGALFTYTPPTPGLRVASAGYTFMKGPDTFRTRRYRDETLGEAGADVISVDTAFQVKAVASLAAFYFAGVDV